MRKILLASFLFVALLAGCSGGASHSTGVYMLIDTSGSYTRELNKAGAVVNYFLGTLQPGDSFAVARINSDSFSEKDILEKTTFNTRPSVANQQKRAFGKRIHEFVATADKGSSHTDISGGILQGIEYLNETGASKKYIFIFSDMDEDLAKGQIRSFPMRLDGVKVVALNVTKSKADGVDPRKYEDRLEAWKKKIESGGGKWRVINDLDRLEESMRD